MSAQQQATRVFSIMAKSAIAEKRGVNRFGQQATAGQAIIGIADHAAALDEAVKIISGETAIAESGAVIDGVVAELMTDASGRFIPWVTPNKVAAIIFPGQTATAAGQMVEVFPIQN
jgi:hypothetical protein